MADRHELHLEGTGGHHLGARGVDVQRVGRLAHLLELQPGQRAGEAAAMHGLLQLGPQQAQGADMIFVPVERIDQVLDVALEPVDMRKQYDVLWSAAQQQLGEDSKNGAVFGKCRRECHECGHGRRCDLHRDGERSRQRHAGLCVGV